MLYTGKMPSLYWVLYYVHIYNTCVRCEPDATACNLKAILNINCI